MIDWWLDLPRGFRFAVPLAIIAVGVVMLAIDFEHGGRGRGAFVIMGFGFALLIADSLMGEERHLKPQPGDLQAPSLLERWAVVPPEKLEAACDVLAVTVGGPFAHQKLHLLGVAAKLKKGALKQFSFSVPFQGASISVQVRLLGMERGETGFGFRTTPELLTALDRALLPILGLPLGTLPQD